jgi:mannose-6-phosphate isomerase
MDQKINSILLLKPLFKERIWGGTKLNQFGYKLPSDHIGECWGISGHPHGESIILNGESRGKSLSEVYREHPEWFNNPRDSTFPLLVKIIDAKQDLSIQVHPDDAYAMQHENQRGKHEAWIVLEAGVSTRIQLGHRAPDSKTFKTMVDHQQWDKLLRYSPLYQDDVIDIKPGTLHALCAGTMVLEVQQSSDVTYRVFDYNRLDAHGNLRALHLNQAIEVTTAPFIDPPKTKLNRHLFNQIQTLVENDHFKIEALGVEKSMTLTHTRYRLVTVIEGEISMNGTLLKKGDHCIVTSQIHSIEITGHGWLIMAEAK